MKTIQSIKDQQIILAREVKTQKGRKTRQRMLLEGEQIIDWALDHQITIHFLLVAKGTAPQSIQKYTNQGIEIYETSPGILKKVTGRNYLIPVIGVGEFPSTDGAVDKNFVLVLDDVKDYGNIGTIIRTCHAFGINKIISTTADFDLFHKKTIEASRGSVFATHLEPFSSGKEVLQALHNRGYQIVATSPRGSSVQSMVELEQKPVALVVGNESHGVSPTIEEMADYLIQIPMSSEIESLNVGVATGISVYEIKLKQVIAMIEEKIKATLGRELNVASMLVQQVLDVTLGKVSDLSSKQVVFMMVLKCDRSMPVEDMCKQFGVLPAEADHFLAPLIQKEYLLNHQDILTLTHRGEEVLSKLWFTVEKTEDQIFSGFAQEEVQAFKLALTRIQQNCTTIINGR